MRGGYYFIIRVVSVVAEIFQQKAVKIRETGSCGDVSESPAVLTVDSRGCFIIRSPVCTSGSTMLVISVVICKNAAGRQLRPDPSHFCCRVSGRLEAATEKNTFFPQNSGSSWISGTPLKTGSVASLHGENL